MISNSLQEVKEEFMKEAIPCWHCNSEMQLCIHSTCFGENLEFYECPDCFFTLDVDFVRKNGSGKPSSKWETPHYIFAGN